MASARAPADEAPTDGPGLRRDPRRGLLGGVLAGIARRAGVEPKLLRLLAAVLALAAIVAGTLRLQGEPLSVRAESIAFSVVAIVIGAYALAWGLIAADGSPRLRRPDSWQAAGLATVGVLALAVGVRTYHLHSGGAFLWSLLLGVAGLGLVWRPLTGVGTERPPSRHLRRFGPTNLPRLVGGGFLVAVASATLLHAAGVQHSFGKAVVAVAVMTTMLGLLVGPWCVRLARSLASERAGRIRQQERAEMAAHLHDSVLQTLALIQRRAADPREVAGLARRQERELRAWLQGPRANAGEDTVVAALERVAAEVEELHGVPIEVVAVGDRHLDLRLDALVQAAREAMTNAAKFAGTPRVDLFAEIGPARAEVFVRDRGVGFDAAGVPPDRRGIRDSILGRMERHDGHASVHSVPGAGTEVELAMDTKVLV